MVRKNTCLIFTAKDVKKLIVEAGLMPNPVHKKEKAKVKTLIKTKKLI